MASAAQAGEKCPTFGESNSFQNCSGKWDKLCYYGEINVEIGEREKRGGGEDEDEPTR